MTRNSFERKMTANEIESELLNALARLGNKGLAERIGKEQSTISHWKENGKFRELAEILHALDFKIVPQEHITAEFKNVDMLFDLAISGLQAQKQAILGQ